MCAVGETVSGPGNKQKTARNMFHLGYKKKDFEATWPDVYNFHRIGNPHLHANIQPGEKVLDVGSGLRINSMVACGATRPDGQVVGIELSGRETRNTLKVARELGRTHMLGWYYIQEP
jgi:tRNA G46 methylase TrmB